ncbi:hypothetical protein CHUAL_006840 [Chamberlinius hualienensis]
MDVLQVLIYWTLLMDVISTAATTLYNPMVEECCDGVRYQIPNNNTYHYCCGDQIITDYESYTCCQGMVRIKPTHDNWRCCNTELIDASETVCINNQPVNIPDEAKYANQENVCANYTVNLYVFYNDTKHLCCDGNIVDKPNESSKCCGHKSYDSQYSLCCNGSNVITDFEGTIDNLECCGNTYYNFLTQICCEDTPVDMGDLIYGHCCGADIYDDSTSICCNNTIFGVDDTNEWGCCGQELYYRKTLVCCESGLTNNQQDDIAAYCCGDDVVYDSESKKCCKNEIYDLDDDYDVCEIDNFCAIYKPAERWFKAEVWSNGTAKFVTKQRSNEILLGAGAEQWIGARANSLISEHSCCRA